ncbi:hypothetical protein DICVIV_06363 [Dictyocaulus viviparus]|uniref:Uncharacterized protein n=1 Tax=Dictyocaulus viviparus TaxID=29172 RepID=A0A0D8XUQ7_DICVI|nr:hypothetical protein DICVIV_06363 [Dictyocaulus viviparus]
MSIDTEIVIEKLRAFYNYEAQKFMSMTNNCKQAALQLIELASFRGDFYRCLLTYRRLIDRFPEEIQYEINVALTFIKMKRFKDAKQVLHNIIEYDQSNGVALAYYGYILKVDEGNIEQGVAYMKKGLRLAEDQISDAK